MPYTAGRLFGSHPEEDGGLSTPVQSSGCEFAGGVLKWLQAANEETRCRFHSTDPTSCVESISSILLAVIRSLCWRDLSLAVIGVASPGPKPSKPHIVTILSIAFSSFFCILHHRDTIAIVSRSRWPEQHLETQVLDSLSQTKCSIIQYPPASFLSQSPKFKCLPC